MTSSNALVRSSLLVACASLGLSACADDGSSTQGLKPRAFGESAKLGGLGIALTIPGGVEVDFIDYEVLDSTTQQVIVAGSVEVSGRPSVLIGLFLQPGTYVLHLHVPGAAMCDGTSAPFTVVSGRDVAVPMVLGCGVPLNIETHVTTFGAAFNPQTCGITRLTVTQSAQGTDVALAAEAKPGAVFAWSTSVPSVGAFGSTAAGSVFFSCGSGGTTTVTVAISNPTDPSCNDSRSMDIVCPNGSLCGNGNVDPGEQCDGDANCNPLCIRRGCGNAVVDPSPPCSP